jgi:hypothetical protein
VDGPRPGTLRPLRPFAVRFPLTIPLRDPNTREALVFWTNGRVITVAFGERMEGRVFDDSISHAVADAPDQVDGSEGDAES